MKKLTFILTLFLWFSGGISSYAQWIKPYPIPSFNVQVNGYANFQELSTNGDSLTDGKRKMHVTTVCHRSELIRCDITVYVYSLDQQDILGPFYPECEETLIVDIDDREWGVLVQSDCEIEVDVWIEETMEM